MIKNHLFTLQKSTVIPLVITIVAIIFGLNNFMSQWMYSEDGHNYLLWGYLGSCAILFILMRMKKYSYIIPLFITMVLIILYANQKFEWRKTYIKEAQSGRPFVLLPYIDHYPSYEDYLFRSINNKPQYVPFTDDCFQPALNNQQPGSNCNNQNQIYNAYNIDITSLINTHYQKMRYTAQQIQAQAFGDVSQFEQCLIDKQCAMIPLLPNGIDEEMAQDPQYIKISQQFWSLIEDDNISADNCDYVDLCRAMRNLGVYTVQTPEENNTP